MLDFDLRVAPLLGKRALVGITYVESDCERHIQVHGVIARAVEHEAIYLQRDDGEFALPPDPDAFRPAQAGRYTLNTTGEVVENPDFTATWTVNAPE